MKKPQKNYAFIDGTNLHLGIAELDWVLDYRRFRLYLREHYGIVRSYYFVGRMAEYENLYLFLETAGFTMKYKEVPRTTRSETKGNIDSELVLQAMIGIDDYDKTVLVSSDGDFACLVNYWRENGKLECVLAPSRKACSHLLKKAARERLYFVEALRHKVEYKKRKGLHKDRTL